ncbi:glutathione S-transferase 1-like [Zophobas morio]|uniref:glutathione S-transferase 1-like n=1 Tax=Zophobas morio TaxID=2755281 RepID=UPI003082FAC1
MAPILYLISISPPARSVLMTAESIGLNLQLKEVNLLKAEHKKPEFLKLNPQHTVPTLVDENGFILWDSHAIMPYLLSKYAKDDTLYPKNATKRALVDQRLHFDSGVAWATTKLVLRPIIYHGKKEILQEHVDAVHEVYSFVESFLEGKQWIAGDSVTIADFSFITTLTSLDVIIKIEATKYPKLVAYLEKTESLRECQATRNRFDGYVALIKSRLA